MINKEILEKEIQNLEIDYINEKNNNGGQDGTILALILKSKIEVLNDLMRRYF